MLKLVPEVADISINGGFGMTYTLIIAAILAAQLVALAIERIK